MTKTHMGSFTQGQVGASYTLTVSNLAGAGPTSGDGDGERHRAGGPDGDRDRGDGVDVYAAGGPVHAQ